MADLVKKFHRAGRARLDAAQRLLSTGDVRFLIDSLYLSGYGIECAMKAMILSGLAASEHEDFVAEHFRGQAAHDFESLYHEWGQNGCERLPRALLRSLRHAKIQWNTDLRYESGLGRRNPRDIAAVVTFAEEIWTWVKDRL